jgi:hypothetical protein
MRKINVEGKKIIGGVLFILFIAVVIGQFFTFAPASQNGIGFKELTDFELTVLNILKWGVFFLFAYLFSIFALDVGKEGGLTKRTFFVLIVLATIGLIAWNLFLQKLFIAQGFDEFIRSLGMVIGII